MNGIFLFLIVSSTIFAAWTGKMEALTHASFEAAKGAVELAIGLVGVMALWLGLIKVAEEAGLLHSISRRLYPILKRLFPDVPKDHPAMSAMVMNIAANMLGLGNAATPLGIKAMQELEKLNPQKGVATDAMCLFLAINTSNVTLLPLGIIAIRASAGATDPAGVILPTLFATSISTLTAITVASFMRKLKRNVVNTDFSSNNSKSLLLPEADPLPPISSGHKLIVFSVVTVLLALIVHRVIQGPVLPALKEISSFWLIPLLMTGILLLGFSRGIKVYETACEGAKEGFNVAIKIIPFLVMILVAVSMFRSSGAFDVFVATISPLTDLIGFPPEVLPVALIRPLSGSGAFGLASEIIASSPNSFASYLASTLQGSTETTFYVLAVYFGSVGIRKYRYALIPALAADVAGALAALFICKLTY
ncbi:nucleoside recognition domain-containing protein [Dissulfuribacter thermophilus]|nr:nucleoside recognition domain-containing protein [Dissulfuribacter thermophilus]